MGKQLFIYKHNLNYNSWTCGEWEKGDDDGLEEEVGFFLFVLGFVLCVSDTLEVIPEYTGDLHREDWFSAQVALGMQCSGESQVRRKWNR